MSPHADASVKLSMLDRKPVLGHINIGLLQTVKTILLDETLDRRPWKPFDMMLWLCEPGKKRKHIDIFFIFSIFFRFNSWYIQYTSSSFFYNFRLTIWIVKLARKLQDSLHSKNNGALLWINLRKSKYTPLTTKYRNNWIHRTCCSFQYALLWEAYVDKRLVHIILP